MGIQERINTALANHRDGLAKTSAVLETRRRNLALQYQKERPLILNEQIAFLSRLRKSGVLPIVEELTGRITNTNIEAQVFIDGFDWRAGVAFPELKEDGNWHGRDELRLMMYHDPEGKCFLNGNDKLPYVLIQFSITNILRVRSLREWFFAALPQEGNELDVFEQSLAQACTAVLIQNSGTLISHP